MDDREKSDPALQEPAEPSADREWQPKGRGPRPDRPAVEPFDPFFGRRRKEPAADLEHAW